MLRSSIQAVDDVYSSNASAIPCSFTDFDDEGRGEEEDCEPPELKYVPTVVKTEVPDELTEEDIDDDQFVPLVIRSDDGNDEDQLDQGDNEQQERERGSATRGGRRGGGGGRTNITQSAVENPSNSKSRFPPGTARRGRGGRGGRRVKAVTPAMENEDFEVKREPRNRSRVQRDDEASLEDLLEEDVIGLDDVNKDQDWSPDQDEDWSPGKSLKKKKAPVKRKRKNQKIRRLKDKIRHREIRRRKKLQVSLQDLVDNGVDVKIEPGEVDGVTPKKSTTTSGRRKRVADMSTEQIERERTRARQRRLREKQLRELAMEKGDISNLPPLRRKKRISEMDPEEAERVRDQWRQKRLREKQRRDAIKIEVTEESDASSSIRMSRRRKQLISEMTPEEAEKARARWREQHKRQREKREKLREIVKSEVTEESDTSCSVRKNRGRPKKRISEMSVEERDAVQAKWRVEHERRRNRRKNMTPEKLEEEKRKARDRQRIRRAMAKEGALPEDQLRSIEMQKEKDRERKRIRRATMTPEQKKEEVMKNTMYRLARQARMTDEDKAARRMHVYMQYVARLATLTPEEIERRRLQRREAGRRRYEKLKSSLGEEGIREMRRNYWHKMTPEKKAKALAKLRECHKRRVERLKQDPEKWEQLRQQWKDRERAYKDRRIELRVQSRKNGTAKPRSTASRKNWAELTDEEKEKRREARRTYWLKRKLAIQKLLDGGMSMEEIQQQTETPEQRERRLIRQRIRKAKANMRARLQSVGATPEEIQKKVEELKHTYQPTYSFRPYKPRPESWRRVDPNEVAKLEKEGKLDNLDEIKPLGLLPKTSTREGKAPAKRTRSLKSAKTDKQYVPGKRGRPFKYPQEHQNMLRQQQQRQKTQQPLQSVALSASSNSIVIVKDDTISNNSSNQQQQSSAIPTNTTSSSSLTSSSYPQQQQQQQQYSQFEHPQQQHTSQPVYIYAHHQQSQQEQQQPLQAQTYSLQHILDGIVYDSTNVTSVVVAAPSVVNSSQQVSYHPQHQYAASTTSSQHEYSSSYYGDDNHSPGGETNFDDTYSDYSSYTQPTQQTLDSSSLGQTLAAADDDATKKAKKPRGPRKYVYRPPKNPNAKTRTKRKDVIRDVVCDECGQGYNRQSLRAHKNQLHNPSYDVANRKCLICGETYKHAQRWYSHYLRDHVRPSQTPAGKSHMCEECGQSFANKENYKKHQYYMHGDGLKKENHIRCPICPEEKLFKEKMSYYSHLKRLHPNYVRPGHDCYRCDQSFPNTKVLGEHVAVEHPESYFRCSFCTAVRFTQLGLYFHYSRCTKILREQRNDIKNKCGNEVFTLEELMLPCELCDKKVILSSLTRHYREMHLVKEDKFTCPECQKVFKTRGFWSIHLEEKHQMPVNDKLKDLLRKLNAVNREGMSIKPLANRFGRQGRGKRKKKASRENEREEKKRRRARRKKKASSDDDDEEEEEDDSEDDDECTSNNDSDEEFDKTKSEKKIIRNKRKRRKVVVIAEEEEIENQ